MSGTGKIHKPRVSSKDCVIIRDLATVYTFGFPKARVFQRLLHASLVPWQHTVMKLESAHFIFIALLKRLHLVNNAFGELFGPITNHFPFALRVSFLLS